MGLRAPPPGGPRAGKSVRGPPAEGRRALVEKRAFVKARISYEQSQPRTAKRDRRNGTQMTTNLIPPEDVTDKQLENYLASLPVNAEKDVRHLLASGAGEAEIAEYMASLGPEPEDQIEPPEGEPTIRQSGFPSGSPSGRQEPPAVQKRPRVRAKQPGALPATPDRIAKRPRGKLGQERYEGPPGVQGANTGYWQAGGVTRAGAKRSKRP
jgi:hypothetical protein